MDPHYCINDSSSDSQSSLNGYEEEEVFFGPIQDKELIKIKMMGNRRTEVHSHSLEFLRVLNTEMSQEDLLKEEEKNNLNKTESETNLKISIDLSEGKMSDHNVAAVNSSDTTPVQTNAFIGDENSEGTVTESKIKQPNDSIHRNYSYKNNRKVSHSLNNSLEISQKPSIKRESYFSSLEMINVNNTELYKTFCSEDTQKFKQPFEKGKFPKYQHSLSDTSGSSTYPSSYLEDYSHCSCNTSVCAMSSSEGYSSCENPNYCKILSQSPSLVSSVTFNENCHSDSNDPPTSVKTENSVHSELENSEDKQVNSNRDISSISSSSDSCSPEKCFNDTIEEMEMLLKHGINYFKNTDTVGNPSGIHDATVGSPSGVHDARVGSPSGIHDANVGSPSGIHDATVGSPSGIHDAYFEDNKQNHTCDPAVVPYRSSENQKELNASLMPGDPDSKSSKSSSEKQGELNANLQSGNSDSRCFKATEDSNQDESIIKQRENSMSTNSVYSFNPNLCSSTDKCKEPDMEVCDIQERPCMSKDIKKIPPPKPPRVIISPALKIQTPKPDSSKPPLKPQQKCTIKSESSKVIPNTTPVNTHLGKSHTKSKLRSIPSTKDIGSTPLKTKIPVSTKTEIPRGTRHGFSTPHNLKHNIKLHSNGKSDNATCKQSPAFQPFLSPNVKNTKQYNSEKLYSSSKKLGNFTSRSRMLNIESPVAKYLKQNPPPPLIATVKPRYKLSPNATSKEHLTPSQTKPVQLNKNSNQMNGQETLRKIEDDITKLNLKQCTKSPLKESNSASENDVKTQGNKHAYALPPSVYHQTKSIHLNKENVCTNRREIPSDRPPTSVLKHKGRMIFPKNSVQLEAASPFKTDKNEIIERSRFSDTTGRASLIEISLYENHPVHYTDTLE